MDTVNIKVVDCSDNREDKQLFRLSDLADELVGFAEKRYQARQNGIPFGPITGVDKVDELLGGAMEPGIHILHGDPGTGKSAFGLQVGASCGCPVLFVTCEMGGLELLRRIMARVTETPLGDLKNGTIEPSKYKKLIEKTAENVPLLTILDAKAEPISFLPNGDCSFSIVQAAEGLRTAPDGDLLVIIDSVHKASRHYGDLLEYDRLNRCLSDIEQLASTLNCPVLCLSERNRANYGSGGMDAAAGSRMFEYIAETVISLNRIEDAQPNMDGIVKVELKLIKNRNGVTGHGVRLSFDGKYQRFTEDK